MPVSGADDYEHALGGLRGHIVYGEQTAGDTPVAWVQVKVALPYLRDAERALVAERTRADAAEADRDYWHAQATMAALRASMPCAPSRCGSSLGAPECVVDPERVVAAVEGLRAECDRMSRGALPRGGHHGALRRMGSWSTATPPALMPRPRLPDRGRTEAATRERHARSDRARHDCGVARVTAALRAAHASRRRRGPRRGGAPRSSEPSRDRPVAHIAASGHWPVSSPGEPDVPLWSMPVASIELRAAGRAGSPRPQCTLALARTPPRPPLPWPTPALGATGEGR